MLVLALVNEAFLCSEVWWMLTHANQSAENEWLLSAKYKIYITSVRLSDQRGRDIEEEKGEEEEEEAEADEEEGGGEWGEEDKEEEEEEWGGGGVYSWDIGK